MASLTLDDVLDAAELAGAPAEALRRVREHLGREFAEPGRTPWGDPPAGSRATDADPESDVAAWRLHRALRLFQEDPTLADRRRASDLTDEGPRPATPSERLPRIEQIFRRFSFPDAFALALATRARVPIGQIAEAWGERPRSLALRLHQCFRALEAFVWGEETV